MSGNTQSTLQGIEIGLTEAEKIIPMLAPFLSMIPGANIFVPFLTLLPTAIEAVQKIQAATGATQSGAIAATLSHLTPGMPNAPALGPDRGVVTGS